MAATAQEHRTSVLAQSAYGDVVDSVTKTVDFKVTYPSANVVVTDGIEIPASKAQEPPTVEIGGGQSANALRDKRFTIMMVDPDAPSPEDPKNREWLHWLIVNTRGTEIDRGDILCNYMGPAPPKGRHRYVFLLFEQLDNADIPAQGISQRAKFSASNFAKSFKMGTPVAATYFYSSPNT